MANIEIRKATFADEEAIINLLEGFYPGVPNHWQKLFTRPHWQAENDFPGFAITDDKKIVGFLGTIFSEQQTSKGKIKFCNLTSWFVETTYRQHTMALLLKVLKLPDVTWTNFTPAPHLNDLLTKIGFKQFQDMQTLILPFPSFSRKKQTIQLQVDITEKDLNPELQSIYHSHQKLNVKHILIKQGEKQCYCVAVITKYKKIPLAKIYYISNPNVFEETIPYIRMKLCFKLNVFYLLAEGSIREKMKPYGFYQKKIFPPRLFKSTVLSKDDINLLYSELLILGI